MLCVICSIWLKQLPLHHIIVNPRLKHCFHSQKVICKSIATSVLGAGFSCLPFFATICTSETNQSLFKDEALATCLSVHKSILINLFYGSKCRDLGVMITQDLSPAVHINEITAKAHQRPNCILRCFVSKDISLLMRAFLVYVRPVVEYCSVIWSPCLKQDIESID